MASKPKLKPCPFCGGEAQLLRISKLPNGVEEWFVSCGAENCDLYPHSTIPYASAEIAAAAWNRRAVGTPSNAAAMREALLLCYRVVHCAMVAGVINRDDANKAMDAYHAALAKPPRNCDRFGGDIDKLREACARERGLNPEEDFPDVFPDWLLAPSTEKEGGEK